jgi:DNA (cytosine-5)-methyltransferase 1
MELPIRFIDLFAGVGGFRSGLTAAGAECVWTNEWDKFSRTTYSAWYPGHQPDDRDIRKVPLDEIPAFEILAAGFPCQPFSLAGVSKKNALGRKHGFDDEHQGNLFFSIIDIANAHRPPILLLENVKNLKSHDKGNTFKRIMHELDQANYHVKTKVIDAAGWVPQHRERMFLVCFAKERFEISDLENFHFPTPPAGKRALKEILEDDVEPKYTLTDNLWNYLQKYAEKHRALGNGFGFGMANLESHSRTLSARYYKDGAEILIPQGANSNPRRITPNEARKLMGFDDKYAKLFGHKGSFPQVVSDVQAYKQFGNSVSPIVVEAIGEAIMPLLAAALNKGN